jgi:hypothetical protein
LRTHELGLESIDLGAEAVLLSVVLVLQDPSDRP